MTSSFLLLLLVPFILGDELISVRCQTKCLDDLQQKYHDNSEMRRHMKHQVVNVCKDDVNCSMCTEPCRESFTDIRMCKRRFCAEASDESRSACEQSCDFLQKIYSEKPGACPAFDDASSVFECAASCHLDGDCPETSKCCSVGCSRKCLQPQTNSTALLPRPSAVSVTERKRRRSAVVRWVMKKMTSSQANSLSNLYVIQWRWGLHEDSLTEWQTILIRNKPYAILKHLLSPGRIYQFRVAAVSTVGSLGFSAPSIPFKLSKEPRAPSFPKLSLGASRLSPAGLWSQIVQWSPPPSDLPIKNYEVSWQQSSQTEADSFEGRIQAALKRSTKEDEEEDSGVDGFSLGGFGGKAQRHSTILASHETSTEIEGLNPDEVYIVEVHATVDSTEGELHGEKGVVFIRTGGLVPPEQMERNEERPTESSLSSLHIGTPHFDKGKLLAPINWADASVCQSRASYVLRLRRLACVTSSPGGWEERVLSGCSTIVDGLEFSCRYEVEVHRQGEEGRSHLSSSFSTSDCHSTPSSSPSPCLPLSPLSCSVDAFVVLCQWPPSPSTATESTIGYRVSLSSSNGGTSTISILPPQSPSTTFEGLTPNTDFTVEVQPITSRGIGSTMITVFKTSPGSERDDDVTNDIVDNDEIDRFDGGEVIELPLESGSGILRWTPLLLILLLVCIRIRI